MIDKLTSARQRRHATLFFYYQIILQGEVFHYTFLQEAFSHMNLHCRGCSLRTSQTSKPWTESYMCNSPLRRVQDAKLGRWLIHKLQPKWGCARTAFTLHAIQYTWDLRGLLCQCSNQSIDISIEVWNFRRAINSISEFIRYNIPQMSNSIIPMDRMLIPQQNVVFI